MKVRKLLKGNANRSLLIRILDGGNEVVMHKGDKMLEQYLDRKVKLWASDGTVNLIEAGMTIVLKEAKPWTIDQL